MVSGCRRHLPQATVVAVSGIAGIGEGCALSIRRVSRNFYLIGDMVSDAADGLGLFATRVGIAASIQSHLIVRLIAGEEK